MIIGVVGRGFVGQATAILGCKDEWSDIEDNVLLVYDTDPEKRSPPDIEFQHMSECDLVFVAVPTPMNEDGSCHTKIVEKVVRELKDVGVEDIVVRSTVPVGTCRRLGVNFMPEFLTEANWEEDFKNCRDWVFGLHDLKNKKIKKKIRKTFLTAKHNGKINHADLHFCSSEAAETCKYVRNCFLATKVSFFNEVEEFCRKRGVDYEHVRELTTMDERIEKSHTAVPGPDGKKGFGGTCFPKDMNSLYYQMSEACMESYIVEGAVARNKQVDRVEEDWKKDKGRAVV